MGIEGCFMGMWWSEEGINWGGVSEEVGGERVARGLSETRKG